MDYPYVAIDKKGRGYLVVFDGKVICTDDDLIQFADDPPKDLKPVNFPVKLFVNHMLAASCHNTYETAVIPELQKHMESYLMPRYLSKEEVLKHLNAAPRPGVADAFFRFWAPPPSLKESEDMATKKTAAKAAPKTAAKAASKAKAAPAKTTKAKAAPAEGTKKRGVGSFCKDLIEAGKTNDEILAAVAKEFPGANTSRGSVAFYRSKMKAGK